MGAQCFHFASKFPKMGDVQHQIGYFWKKISGQE